MVKQKFIPYWDLKKRYNRNKKQLKNYIFKLNYLWLIKISISNHIFTSFTVFHVYFGDNILTMTHDTLYFGDNIPAMTHQTLYNVYGGQGAPSGEGILAFKPVKNWHLQQNSPSEY